MINTMMCSDRKYMIPVYTFYFALQNNNKLSNKEKRKDEIVKKFYWSF